jgi:hypothetical protein
MLNVKGRQASTDLGGDKWRAFSASSGVHFRSYSRGRGRKNPQSADQGVQASGCCCLLRDDLGHSAMVPECPAFSRWDISGGNRGLDPPPGTVSRETDYSIPDPGPPGAERAGVKWPTPSPMIVIFGGTDGSNPVSSSGESANPRSRST